LRRLVGGKEIVGKNFLDIGCGSGLHSLAALRLGAKHVRALDIDADSVATTRLMLERYTLPPPKDQCRPFRWRKRAFSISCRKGKGGLT
jgi:ribosomal protein L11 methylase PrmA